MTKASWTAASDELPIMNSADRHAASLLASVERFLEEVDRQVSKKQQISLLLSSVCEDTPADAAFWYSAEAHRVLDSFSNHAVPADYYNDLFRQSIQDKSDQVLRVRLNSTNTEYDSAFLPTSLAMVKLGSSGHNWLVAMTFGEQQLEPVDLRLMKLIAKLLLKHRSNLQIMDKYQQTLYGLVLSLTAAIDAKDPYTCGHSERVARIAFRIGQQMGLSDYQLSDLRLGGLLHDVGKIGVADDVLRKAGPLEDHEFEQIKQHPIIGDRIVSQVKQLSHLRPIVRSHHERFDGRCYPDGLSGTQTPLLARITAVADGCDAMMRDRTYRPAIPKERILTIFEEGSGSQWDAEVVKHFMECAQDIFSIYERGIGESFFVAIKNTGRGDG